MNISKENFEAYENVRVSGVTNMFDLNNVMSLSGLTKAQIIYIMSNYSDLGKQFQGEQK